MRVIWGVLIILSLLLFTGCDLLGIDSDIIQIIKDGNPEACGDLTADSPKETTIRVNKCYQEYAWSYKDAALCEKVSDSDKHDECIVNLAEDLVNLDLCEKTKYSPNECYSKVGIAKNDESICFMIDDRMFNNKDKDACNKAIAIKKQSIEICERIKKGPEELKCIMQIAADKQDITICDEVGRWKHNCINNIAAVAKDPTICEESKLKSDCYENLAIITENSDLCTKVGKYDDDEDGCYEKVAKITKNMEICNYLHNERAKWDCFEDFAEDNVSACQNIDDNVRRDECEQKFGYYV